MAQPVAGTLTHLRYYAHSVNSDLCVDPNHRLLFTLQDQLSSYKYQIDGTIALVDTENPPSLTDQSLTIDTTRHFVFHGGQGGGTDARVYCYSYDDDGNMTLVNGGLRWGANGCQDLHIDTINRIIVAATFNADISTYSYNDAGMVTGIDDDDRGYNVVRAGIDAYNNIAFTSRRGAGGHLASYTYNPVTSILAWVETVAPALGTCSNVEVDSDASHRFGFVGVTAVGLQPFTYDADGQNLTVGTPINLGGTPFSIALDRASNLLFLANDTRGVDSFRYNPTTGALTWVDNEPTQTSSYRIIVDPVNFMVFCTGGGGLSLGIHSYSYIPSTVLALRATASPAKGKAPLDVSFTSKLYWVNGDTIFGDA